MEVVMSKFSFYIVKAGKSEILTMENRRLWFVFLFGAVVFFFWLSNLYATGWLPQYQLTTSINNSYTSDNLQYLEIGKNGDVHIVWYDKRDNNDYEIYYKKWNGLAAKWDSIDLPLTENEVMDVHPTLNVDKYGNIHVVWSSCEANPSNPAVFYKKWDASNQTWSANMQMSSTYPAESLRTYASIASDTIGNLHLVWYDCYRKWDAGTQLWEETDTIIQSTGDIRFTAVTTSPDCDVHVVWEDDRDGSWEIYYKKWDHLTQTWSSDFRVSDIPNSSTCPQFDVDISNNIHIVWQDKEYGNAEILYRKWDAGTGSWQPITRLTNDPGNSYNPSISCDGEGNLHVAWEDDAAGIKYKKWDNGLQVWLPDTLLDNYVSLLFGLPDIVSEPNENLHLAWFSDINYGGDWGTQVFYKKYQSGIADISVSPDILIFNQNGKPSWQPRLKSLSIPATMEMDEYWVDVIPNEVIVGFTNSVNIKSSKVEKVITQSGGKIIWRSKTRLNFVVANVPGNRSDIISFIKTIEKDKDVKYAEPARYAQPFFTPNDPDWPLQWGPVSISAPDAWDIEQGSSDIILTIIDTGIDYNHPDLNDQFTGLKGRNTYLGTDDPMPDTFMAWPGEDHGTYCAGIAAAEIDNLTGIAGLAQIHLYAVKATSYSVFHEYSIADGIQWAADHGSHVISMSFGFLNPSSVIKEACENAWEAGCLLVAATGNGASNKLCYPAAFPTVIQVGAIDTLDNISTYSNYGPTQELVAPGDSVYSTVPQSYGWYKYYRGCSAACAHVAGVASLVFSKNPSLTNDQVRAILDLTSDDLGTPGWDQFYGYGKINAYNAVLSASGGIVSSDSATLWVYNSDTATGNLNVSAITHNHAWIISVEPTFFAVGPGDSVGINVVVNSSGLPSGTYYDTLYVFSDDPDENPYPIPVILHLVGIEEAEKTTQAPVVNALYHACPNPFKSKARISYSVAKESKIKLEVYNVAGQKVKTLINEKHGPGHYKTIWNGWDDKSRRVSAGVYFMRLAINPVGELEEFNQIQKVVYMK